MKTLKVCFILFLLIVPIFSAAEEGEALIKINFYGKITKKSISCDEAKRIISVLKNNNESKISQLLHKFGINASLKIFQRNFVSDGYFNYFCHVQGFGYIMDERTSVGITAGELYLMGFEKIANIILMMVAIRNSLPWIRFPFINVVAISNQCEIETKGYMGYWKLSTQNEFLIFLILGFSGIWIQIRDAPIAFDWLNGFAISVTASYVSV